MGISFGSGAQASFLLVLLCCMDGYVYKSHIVEPKGAVETWEDATNEELEGEDNGKIKVNRDVYRKVLQMDLQGDVESYLDLELTPTRAVTPEYELVAGETV